MSFDLSIGLLTYKYFETFVSDFSQPIFLNEYRMCSYFSATDSIKKTHRTKINSLKQYQSCCQSNKFYDMLKRKSYIVLFLLYHFLYKYFNPKILLFFSFSSTFFFLVCQKSLDKETKWFKKCVVENEN